MVDGDTLVVVGKGRRQEWDNDDLQRQQKDESAGGMARNWVGVPLGGCFRSSSSHGRGAASRRTCWSSPAEIGCITEPKAIFAIVLC